MLRVNDVHHAESGKPEADGDDQVRPGQPRVLFTIVEKDAKYAFIESVLRAHRYRTTGLWPGLPTGRVSNSAISRSGLSLDGMRIAYFTRLSSTAS